MTVARIENDEGKPGLNRRMLLRAAGLGALAGLTACATAVLPTGEGAGVSASAAGTLAGIRASAGLAPLLPDPQLERAALQQAGYMARGGRMNHTTG
ncbi:MAG: CAP domain-containing protein, partial [Mesorhizobium sp.]